MLLGTATLGRLSHNALVSTNAHAALPVTSQGIMSREDISAKAFVRLVSSVDLCMSFQIMSTHEALVTVITLVLAITKVSLDMGFDVLLSAKPSVTARVQANPLSIFGIRTINVGGDLINGDTGLCDRCVDPGIKVEVVN